MEKETKKAMCLISMVIGGIILMLLNKISANFYNIGIGLLTAGLVCGLYEFLMDLKNDKRKN